MSFSFGFDGDDIEADGEGEEQDALTNHISGYTISDTDEKSLMYGTQPKRHTLEELVSPCSGVSKLQNHWHFS